MATVKAEVAADLRSAESYLDELLLAQFLSEPADGIPGAREDVEVLKAQLATYEIIEPLLAKELVKWGKVYKSSLAATNGNQRLGA